MVCRQIRQIGLSLHHYSPNFLQRIPCPVARHLSNPEHHRKLAFQTQNKTLHLFWVLLLCWSLAWLHNSLLKPFCSNICRELCKVISVHCQARLRFILALTPSVKIRQCFTAWVNPYRCPYLSGTKTTLMWHGCLDWDSQALVSDEDLKRVWGLQRHKGSCSQSKFNWSFVALLQLP